MELGELCVEIRIKEIVIIKKVLLKNFKENSL